MKIIHLIFALPNAGKENLLIDIVNAQSKDNDLTVIIINNIYDENLISNLFNRVNVLKLNRKPGSKSILPIIKLYFYIIKLNPDVIHCHDMALISFFPFKLPNIKIFSTVHITGLYCKKLNGYKKVFVISNAVKNCILKSGNLKIKEKIVLVYNGIDFSTLEQKKVFVINNHLKIAQIGRLEINQKGQDVLIKALHILNEKKDFPFVCEFIGDGKDYNYLYNLTKNYNLSNRITFLKNKSRSWVYKNLKYYDLLVQPSRIEGFGLSIVEAMGAKVPIIASNIDGPLEILENGNFGIIFENESAEDLAKQIYDVYLLYKENNIINLVEKNYSYVSQKFSIEKTVNNYLIEYGS